jgi:hypothetical protein
MFQPVAEHYVDDPRPLNRLAFAYAHEGNAAAAARTYIELDQIFPDFPYNRGDRAWAYAYVGDSIGSEAVGARCVEAGDGDCAARLFMDVLSRRRNANQVTRELLAAAYPLAAPTLRERLNASGLRAVAAWLRGQELEELAQRADGDAAMRDAAGGARN